MSRKVLGGSITPVTGYDVDGNPIDGTNPLPVEVIGNTTVVQPNPDELNTTSTLELDGELVSTGNPIPVKNVSSVPSGADIQNLELLQQILFELRLLNRYFTIILDEDYRGDMNGYSDQ